MGWLVTLGILVLLGLIPLGVSVIYDEDGVLARIIAGPLKIKVYPLPHKEKKPKKEKPKKEKSPRRIAHRNRLRQKRKRTLEEKQRRRNPEDPSRTSCPWCVLF